MPIPTEVNPTETIALCSSFPGDGIPAALDFWMGELGFPLRTELTPFNQVFQQLLDPESLIAKNGSGVNAIAIRLEDLESAIPELASALAAFAKRSRVPVILVFAPCTLKKPEEELATALATSGKVQIIRSFDFEDTFGPRDWQLRSAGLESFSFNEEFFAAFGTLVARKIHALRAPERKAIVLDCDETLWRGVCAEDRQVLIDPPHRALHEFIRDQHDAGMLICLASKNREEDILRALKNEGMSLRAENFAAIRANWQPKSENIRALAEELRIGLDSLIFIDDNPLEIAEVTANCPEVVSLQLPGNPEEIPSFLRRVWAFDRPRSTEEDRFRADFYRQNKARDEAQSASPTLEEFLAKLELQVAIRPITTADLPRVAQLTQRTTQFNCSTIRRTEAELHSLLDTRRFHGEIANVKDRFGDYGDVGLLLYEFGTDALSVDTFLLSCRALGRGVEEQMLRRAAAIAHSKNLNWVDVNFTRTPRNEPAFDFLQSAPSSTANGNRYRFDSKLLSETKGRFAAKHVSHVQKAISSRARRIDYQKIATVLSDLENLSAQIQNKFSAIEQTLLEHPAIRSAVVRPYERDGQRLAVYVVVDPIRSPRIAGRPRFTLPNGLAVVEQSRIETEALYLEMFDQRIYFQNGISLRDGDCVIDAGANIGMFTIYTQTAFPNARIYSFEPAPPVFELLRINTSLYAPHAKIFNLGVSDQRRRATIEFHPHLSGASSYFESDPDVTDSRTIIERQLKGAVETRMLADYTAELTKRAAITQRFETETIGLSEFFRQAGIAQVELLKVDVEKSEMNLLRGITPEDWPKIDQVVLEVHSDDLRDQCCAFLQERGFDVTKDQAPERIGTRLSYLYAKRSHRTPGPLPGPRTFSPPLTANELRDTLREKFPDAPPLDFIFLDSLSQPLPEPSSTNADLDSFEVESENPLQSQLAAIWKNVLGIERIGAHQTFSELGGSSSVVQILLSRIEDSFGIKLPAAALAESPTLAALSVRLETELISQLNESEIRDALAAAG